MEGEGSTSGASGGQIPAQTRSHYSGPGTEEESSDRHSSDEETDAGRAGGAGGAGGWAVSEAQARHYAAQFAQLRPDRGLLSGHTARLFFEKSRLPVADLRKIWQLADITKDGALSLEEFSIAMHLIVLRRADVPVPDALPPALRPAPRAAATDLRDLAPAMLGSGSSADFNLEPPASPPAPAAAAPELPAKPEPLKEWTKFVDSPTSSVSSPGPKPVNFDFQKAAVERDPKIFHPVALRVTPDGDERASTSPKRDAELKPLQRPQPKKPLKPGGGALPPPPARDEPPGRKEPPPPPPRPLRHHARSSSLDLTRLKSAPPPPPLPPPRTSPAPAPAFAPPEPDDPPLMHGAFEVYRKPAAAAAGAGGEGGLRALQEQNAALQRVCRALLAELADTQQEKETLRAQLDPAL
ncbi:unnamed protein product [Plutella xylostella]|uniref:(diamondback moth) hypothetical protein n=1 Tax=Plutella xylostella TaxID=51655 RepID=A0A8S4E7U5_PLUXY|nr:unnamed protein product [Plutella xylostella]